jgi:hypothetical protein
MGRESTWGRPTGRPMLRLFLAMLALALPLRLAA